MPTTVVNPAANDWSGLKPIQAQELLQISKGTGNPAANKAVTPTKPKASVRKRRTKSKPDSHTENSGIRQEPGLPEHEDVAPEIERPFNPFDPDADTAQDETAQNQQAIDRTMRSNAHNASLNPGDGIEL